MQQYWHIAAGSNGRDYSQYFLKYGIAFVGGESKFSQRMAEVKEGDVIVLKVEETIIAGTVVQRSGKHRGCCDKEWLKDFDGWELPAYCYVDWILPTKELEESLKTYRTGTINKMKTYRTGTINKIWVEDIRRLAVKILNSGNKAGVSEEPPEPEPVKIDEILECLKKAGLEVSEKNVCRIRSLAKYYYEAKFGWDWVLEHETRTFLVIPLLLALGWTEKQMKIELSTSGRKRIDIACFKNKFAGENNDCVVIIETKAFHIGLDYADKQAEIYSEKFPSCEVLITTNGYCYKIYKKNDGKFEAHAYMNLLKLTKKYPIDPDNVDGALEAIKYLLPNTYPLERQNGGTKA